MRFNFFELNAVELYKQATISTQLTDDSGGVPTVSSSENNPTPPSLFSSSVAFITRGLMAGSSSPQQNGSTQKEDTSFSPGTMNMKNRPVLLYYYYGAMIFCALEQWENAELFLEHAILVPTMRTWKPSAILLEVFKKYVLVGLILGRIDHVTDLLARRSLLPIHRSIVPLATVYTRLPNLIRQSIKAKKNVAQSVADYLRSKFSDFQKDCNVGLVKRVIYVCKETAIRRLGNVFVALHLKDASRLAFLTEHETEQMIRSQIDQLVVRIDSRAQTFRFEEENPTATTSSDDDQQHYKIEQALNEVITLSTVIRSFDDAVRQNPNYIAKKLSRGDHHGGKRRRRRSSRITISGRGIDDVRWQYGIINKQNENGCGFYRLPIFSSQLIHHTHSS